MGEKLTAGQRGLISIIAAGESPRAIDLRNIKRKGLTKEFAAARRARLIYSAGYETSVAGDDFLASPAGRQALDQNGGEHGG